MRGSAGEIQSTIRRLESHFERVDLPPPAAPHALAALRNGTPGLPPELRTLYALANGLRVHTRDFDAGRLFSAEEVVESHRITFAHLPLPVRNLLPVRGDGCGNFDCIVVGGAADGSVVFWDREVYDRPSLLLGSSFGRYLRMWSQALIHEHLPNGDRHPDARAPELPEWPWLGTPKRQHPWPLNLQWILGRDSGVTKLLASDEVLGWLRAAAPAREPFDLYFADTAADFHEGGRVSLDGIDGFFDQYFETKEVGQTLTFVVHEGAFSALPRRIEALEAMPFISARVLEADSTHGVVEILARTTLGRWVRSLTLEARPIDEIERALVDAPIRDVVGNAAETGASLWTTAAKRPASLSSTSVVGAFRDALGIVLIALRTNAVPGFAARISTEL